MRDKFNKIIHSRVFIIILILILACSTLLLGTYAWFTWSSTDNTKFVMSIGRLADVTFTNGNDISAELTPVFNYSDGLTTDFTINNRDTSGTIIGYDVYFNITAIDNELISSDVKWAIEKNGRLVNEGDLSQVSNGSTIRLRSDTMSTGNTSYIFYLYIDGNVENDLSMIGKTIIGNLMVEASETKVNLLEHITNLYANSYPELITQEVSNDSYYYSYQDADETWGLMNDGLKVDNALDATTTGLATTVTDTTALTTGTEGNIRYFGPSDNVNNYIYFNCNDYSNQSLTDANGEKNCELWRIIGIVDGKVKIIKEESIGNLAWDQDKNQNESLTTYNNNWTTSSLQEFLNGLYYNRGTIDEHTYYSESDGATTKTLYLSDIGITEATRNNSLISESTWYLGGYSSSSGLYPNDIYNYERQNKVGTTIYSTNDFIINKNIGLMYPSDYGYGTDLTKCSKDIYNYESSENSYACRANNWLYNNAVQWLITPRSGDSGGAWYVYDGRVYYYYVYGGIGARPALYLNSELGMESGHAGTNTDPYRISV